MLPGLSSNALLFARNSLHLREFMSSCLSVATNLGSSLLVFQLALLVVLVTVKTSSVSWFYTSAGRPKPFGAKWLIIGSFLFFPVIVIILLIKAYFLSSLLKKEERGGSCRDPVTAGWQPGHSVCPRSPRCLVFTLKRPALVLDLLMPFHFPVWYETRLDLQSCEQDKNCLPRDRFSPCKYCSN